MKKATMILVSALALTMAPMTAMAAPQDAKAAVVTTDGVVNLDFFCQGWSTSTSMFLTFDFNPYTDYSKSFYVSGYQGPANGDTLAPKVRYDLVNTANNLTVATFTVNGTGSFSNVFSLVGPGSYRVKATVITGTGTYAGGWMQVN
ncbi:hypothetical protein CIG75_00785 [Tumebacillus algifaecis]|uniref:Uncharacterized protein n=1 Tax=Tumebacillus algifaecis TaxID=1214604 RepID=A0A223CWS6_9BACL|nr:hypothetical protein [Tumebacillus algifaecis]ASS73654.1 hypothetical protein CIG75_00785 [Tumebacillus algifaecis]